MKRAKTADEVAAACASFEIGFIFQVLSVVRSSQAASWSFVSLLGNDLARCNLREAQQRLVWQPPELENFDRIE